MADIRHFGIVAALTCSIGAIVLSCGDAEAQSSFTGPSVGIAIGYGTTELDSRKTITIPPFEPTEEVGSIVSGITGTLFAGYNHKIGERGILGFEIDATASDWSGTFHNDDYDVRWTSTARLRVGYEVRQDLLMYVTGGAAWMHMRVAPDHLTSFTKVLPGYVVGAGLEYIMHPSARMRLEYLYSNYTSWSFDPTPLVNERLNPDTHQVRLGIVIPLKP